MDFLEARDGEKGKSKVRQANDTQNITDLNIPTQPEGGGEVFKISIS